MTSLFAKATGVLLGITLASTSLARGPVDPPEPRDQTQLDAQPLVESSGEVIEERFASGALKVVREVFQDADGNFLKHGAWQQYNERGALIVDGQYDSDVPHGAWSRWYAANEAPFAREQPYANFAGPLISQGDFHNGVLHGAWRIVDTKGRKISEIQLREGQREGLAVWWHPSGRVMREVQYENGLVHGVWQEWREDGALLARHYYDRGRKQTVRKEFHQDRQPKSETVMLEPALAVVKLDNWSTGELAKYAPSGKPIRHGSHRAWHPGGTLMVQGEYKYGLPVGTFTWWYANGQRSIEGTYEDGEQQGVWSWWHANGMRSIRGNFSEGNPDLTWTWWNDDGKVAQVTDMSHQRPTLEDGEPTLAELPSPSESSGAAPPVSNRRRR